METKETIQLILFCIIIIGIVSAFWSYSQAVNESLKYAQTLDIANWGNSLVKVFLTGITLIFAGIIGEILVFVSDGRPPKIV